MKHILCLIFVTLVMALPGLAHLPVIDRDEARYAQASVQMRETGDLVEIKFQDEARNKKPAGIYWLHTAALTVFSSPQDRSIWIHRLPSVLGALIAVLATYWAGLSLMNRQAAFTGSLLLATSLLFVFEAHIAKTDAMLCGMAVLIFACLAKLRHEFREDDEGVSPEHRHLGILFWVFLALTILIKGPIMPAIIVLALGSLWIWERDLTWVKPLRQPLGLLLCGFIVLPWFIFISIATDGQFFADAFIGDFGSKLVSAQETHGGPPGLYAATISLFFWPASAFLLMGLVYTFRTARSKMSSTEASTDADTLFMHPKAARFLLAWAIPFWIILELLPTKLPHYLLPAYPALALMCGAALIRIFDVDDFTLTRRLGALIALIATALVCTAILYVESLYGHEVNWPFIVAFIVLLSGAITAYGLWTTRARLALTAAIASAIILSPLTYQFILPTLDSFKTSQRIAESLTNKGITLPRLDTSNTQTLFLSPQFTEPSLVYHIGTDIRLGDAAVFNDSLTISDMVLLVDRLDPDAANFMEDATRAAETRNQCWTQLDNIKGFNYSKGKPVDIDILHLSSCPQTDGSDASAAL